MSFAEVRAYFEKLGCSEKITVHEKCCDTVVHAAENIGCTEAEIAKTISFNVDGRAILIVCAGDAKVKNAKFKGYFGKKPVMITFDEVESMVGHAPGGVCPFAVKEGVEIYLDESLRRFKVVYAAGGSEMATIELTLPELEGLAKISGWVDVCGGWNE